MKVAIRLGSLGTGSLKKDIQRSLAIGVHGLQLRVVDTELDPRELSDSGREEFVDYIESFGFDLPAISGELSGFADPATVDERVARTRSIIDLSVDLHCPVVCVDPGVAPADGTQRHVEFVGAIRDLANYALERDIRIALTTGDDSVERLSVLIASVNSEGLRVNYEPAALVSHGFDPIAGLDTVVRKIAHVQARDAARGSITEPGAERPLSKGDARIEELISVLLNNGYTGFLSVATQRDEDLAGIAVEAVTWLQKQEGVDP
ncbi:MAG: sugar phosphate isomerase/epimerase family protein [Candidatus Hydrogenedentes bacterium]|nr:sugar phosphate isomerase/epimerase family protein [Candidatus Hydrogenedentota bacterium]